MMTLVTAPHEGSPTSLSIKHIITDHIYDSDIIHVPQTRYTLAGHVATENGHTINNPCTVLQMIFYQSFISIRFPKSPFLFSKEIFQVCEQRFLLKKHSHVCIACLWEQSYKNYMYVNLHTCGRTSTPFMTGSKVFKKNLVLPPARKCYRKLSNNVENFSAEVMLQMSVLCSVIRFERQQNF